MSLINKKWFKILIITVLFIYITPVTLYKNHSSVKTVKNYPSGRSEINTETFSHDYGIHWNVPEIDLNQDKHITDTKSFTLNLGLYSRTSKELIVKKDTVTIIINAVNVKWGLGRDRLIQNKLNQIVLEQINNNLNRISHTNP